MIASILSTILMGKNIMREKGVLYGIGAYLIWGFFPVYFKALLPTPALQILFHRIVGSFLFMALLMTARREWSKLRAAISGPRILLTYCLSAGLLAANWFTYTWAVNAGYVVETSLGYFINPLVNVLLGVVLLRERLRPLQWLPVGLAAAGVLFMSLQLEAWPWIALVVAFTFGFYGLIKKVAPLDALHGTSLEMAILFVPALAYLLYADFQGFGSFGHLGWSNTLLLALAGVITALPLLMFATAARSIPLTLLGLLQYIAPTCQFLLGVLLYKEPFTTVHMVGFGLIWTALLIYTLEGFFAGRRKVPTQAAY